MPVRDLRQRQRCRAPASLLPGRQPTPTAPSLERYAICRLATGDALPREAVPQQRIPRLGCQRKVSRLGLAGSFHLVDRRNPRAPTQPHPGTHAGWQRSVLPFLGRPSPATDTRPPRRESARSTADVRPLPDQWQSTRNRPEPSPCRPSLPLVGGSAGTGRHAACRRPDYRYRQPAAVAAREPRRSVLRLSRAKPAIARQTPHRESRRHG